MEEMEKKELMEKINAMVNTPKHYVQAGVFIEPIDVLRYAPFSIGNALKYLFRVGHKDDPRQELKKAEKYLHWAIEEYEMNPEPFDNFMKHYGLILSKYPLFGDWKMYTFKDLKERLQGIIISQSDQSETFVR